jgi:hypothetical protein
MPQPSASGQVWRNGLIFGAIIATLMTGNVIFRWLASGYDITSQTNESFTTVNDFATGGSFLLGCVIFLVVLTLTFVAGMLTSRKTGGVGSGSLAGLVAGASGALLGGVVNVIVVLTLVSPGIPTPAGSDLTQSQIQALLIGGEIFGLVISLFLYGGFGAGLGALGGLVGRNSYEKANPPQPYPGSFYPGVYPGAPMQPGAYYPSAPYPGPQYPGAPYSGAPYPGPQYPTSPAPPYAPPPPYAGPQYPVYPAPPYPGQQPPMTPYPSQADAPAQPPQEPQPPQ